MMRSSGFHTRRMAATASLLAASLGHSVSPPRLEAAAGFRDFNYGNTVTVSPTGEKPESKLWWNDGYWWGSLWDPTSNRYSIHRFDAASQSWASTGTAIDARVSSKADALWDGARLYIVSHPFTTTPRPVVSPETPGRLYRYSYSPATQVYTLDAGFPVNVNSSRTEALVLDKDSSGKLWVTWVEAGKVKVNRTLGDDLNWGTPFDLPVQGDTTSADDISSIVAFGGDRVGIMWSNAADSSVYFAIHRDGNPDTQWEPREVALADPVLGKVVDDHINLKWCDATGALYAAIKTNLNVLQAPGVYVLRRQASGVWSRHVFSRVMDDHTRPILLLDPGAGMVYVFATKPEAGGIIYMKSASIADLQFPVGLGTAFIESADDSIVNNPTSTKQCVSDSTGILVLASDTRSRYYLHNYMALAGPPNIAPVVDAGSAQTVTLGAGAELDGTVSDDGLPSPPGLTTVWSWASGPAPVGFQDENAVDTHASFTAAGTYVLRLTADDGDLSASDTVRITVVAPPVISYFNPASGPVGSEVEVHGAGLLGVEAVAFNGMAAPFVVASDTLLLATVPTGATTGPIAVTTPAGSDTSALEFMVTYTTYTVERHVATGDDDAEEDAAGTLHLDSSDLELVFDGSNQLVGVRFTNVSVRPGAVIVRAYVQFEAKETQSEATSLLIQAEAADNPVTFSASNKISTRPPTAAQVSWEPAPWTLVGEGGLDQRTPDLAAVIQEIVNRPGWVSGSAMVILISGTGHRTAKAYELNGPPLLHIEAGGLPPDNTAPLVDAGPADAVTLAAEAVLDGTVSDDGFPNPPGALTTTWSMASGPGPVSFQDASAVDTRASFTTVGNYLLRLTASDGELSASDTVGVTVEWARPGTFTVERRIAAGSDDAKENPAGNLSLAAADLELGNNQRVGLRFLNVGVPPGATISRAYVQFEADETQSVATSLLIQGEAADDPVTFSASNKISTRPPTVSWVNWTPAPWPVVGLAGLDQRTPDLTAVVQEIVNRRGWASGNAMVMLITGTGRRTAKSYEGEATGAPLLHIEAGPPNTAPLVDAGPADVVTLAAGVALNGKVSDDGLPNPPGALTTTWSKASGPGPVSFEDTHAVDTRASFTAVGSYLLRLSASDGTLSASDTVSVTVEWSPPGTFVVERRVAAGSDDAEESVAGTLTLNSEDLELMFDDRRVGLRFTNVAVPPGAVVSRAYVQFEADETQSVATSLLIQGEGADDPVTFSTSNKVSTRPRTVAQASWAPAPWTLEGVAGLDQRTPNLAGVVQEIVNRPGWASGNAMVMLFSGTGHRTAKSYEGASADAPLLHIEAGPPPDPVAVADATTPRSLALHQNRPNPFAAAGTTISFELPATARVRLAVYDTEGRKIRVLEEAQLPPGTHTARWDGRDGAGTALPNGLYFLRLEVPGTVHIRKMLLIR